MEHKRRGGEIVPKLWRTRKLVMQEGRVICSCSLFITTGISCRHFYALTQVSPDATHCSPKHLKRYATHYALDKDYTAVIDKSLLTLREGIPIPMSFATPGQSKGGALQFYGTSEMIRRIRITNMSMKYYTTSWSCNTSLVYIRSTNLSNMYYS